MKIVDSGRDYRLVERVDRVEGTSLAKVVLEIYLSGNHIGDLDVACSEVANIKDFFENKISINDLRHKLIGQRFGNLN